MRKFDIRWWLKLPAFEVTGAHSHFPGVIVQGLCIVCAFGVPTVPIFDMRREEGSKANA